MENEIITQPTIEINSLAVNEGKQSQTNPAIVYLEGQRANSRRLHAQHLGVIADILAEMGGTEFTPPTRPDYPGARPTPEARAAYDLAKAAYKADREQYDNRSYFIPWGELRYKHTQAIRARLIERGKSVFTTRGMITSLRGVLEVAWILEQMTAEDYQRAIHLDQVIGSTLPAGRGLSSGEIAGLMQACENDPSPAGARDAAIIALMYTCGLRRDEVVKLSLASYDTQNGELRIIGKRNKERLAYLVNGAADAMADWLNIRGSEGDPLFVAIGKGSLDKHGHAHGWKLDASKQLTNQVIYNMLAKRGAQAGIKKFSPHDLRRSFITDQLDAGEDSLVVAAMAGHDSVATTARYDRRGERAKQKAAGNLHIPYRKRMI